MDDYDLSCREIKGKVVREKGSKDYEEVYCNKLEEYIREKEKNIINVNTKKSLSSLY